MIVSLVKKESSDTMNTKGSKHLIKELNEKLVLRTIHENLRIDRASIAKITGLSPATVTKITASLMKQGMIREVGSAESSGGRRPVLLSLNPSFGCFLGIKIGVGYVELVATDFTGKPLERKQCETDENDPKSIVSIIKSCWNSFHIHTKDRLLGIGVAVSGVVDSERGLVKDSFLLKWRDVPIVEMLSKTFHCEALVMNDVDSFAMSHLWLGNARNHSNAVVVTLGVGIGGALIINGKIHTAKGGVGEIGHMTVVQDGALCTCGSRGCLEAEASFAALVRKIANATTHKGLKELYKSVRQSERSEIEYLRNAKRTDRKAFQRVFDEYAQLVGIALKNIINTLAPDYLLIGGEALEFAEDFLDNAIQFAVKNSFGRLGEGVVFEVDDLNQENWALGSIYKLIDEKLFRVSQK